MNLQIEIYEENGNKYIWIGTESGSGGEYEIDDKMSPGKALDMYLEYYKEGEL